MKKIILTTITTVLGTTAVFAQPQKGDWMVGAGIANGQAYLQTPGYNQFNVQLTPLGGYFAGNRIALGTGVGLGYAAGRGAHSLGYSISPFARYYFAGKQGIQLQKPVLFAEASMALHGYSAVDKINNWRYSDMGLSGGAGVGLAYFINQHVSVEGLFKLNSRYTYHNNVGRGVTPSLGIGFNIYLKGKKRKAEVVK